MSLDLPVFLISIGGVSFGLEGHSQLDVKWELRDGTNIPIDHFFGLVPEQGTRAQRLRNFLVTLIRWTRPLVLESANRLIHVRQIFVKIY